MYQLNKYGNSKVLYYKINIEEYTVNNHKKSQVPKYGVIQAIKNMIRIYIYKIIIDDLIMDVTMIMK